MDPNFLDVSSHRCLLTQRHRHTDVQQSVSAQKKTSQHKNQELSIKRQGPQKKKVAVKVGLERQSRWDLTGDDSHTRYWQLKSSVGKVAETGSDPDSSGFAAGHSEDSFKTIPDLCLTCGAKRLNIHFVVSCWFI